MNVLVVFRPFIAVDSHGFLLDFTVLVVWVSLAIWSGFIGAHVGWRFGQAALIGFVPLAGWLYFRHLAARRPNGVALVCRIRITSRRNRYIAATGEYMPRWEVEIQRRPDVAPEAFGAVMDATRGAGQGLVDALLWFWDDPRIDGAAAAGSRVVIRREAIGGRASDPNTRIVAEGTVATEIAGDWREAKARFRSGYGTEPVTTATAHRAEPPSERRTGAAELTNSPGASRRVTEDLRRGRGRRASR